RIHLRVRSCGEAGSEAGCGQRDAGVFGVWDRGTEAGDDGVLGYGQRIELQWGEVVQHVLRGEVGEGEGWSSGDRPAGQCAGEWEWRAVRVLPVWGGAGNERGWTGEVWDVCEGFVGFGLCGSTLLQRG